eukprot:jgi/Bigna1/74205/fgenesh1_pg.28_\
MGNGGPGKEFEDGTGSCPQCTFQNGSEASKCEVCGHVFKASPGSCPACTFANDPSAESCSMCGTVLIKKNKKPGRAASSEQISKSQKALKAAGTHLHGDKKKDVPVFAAAAFRPLPNMSVELKTNLTVSYKEASALLDAYKEIRGMKDRTQRHPVKTFILSTLTNGLPLFNKMPEINKEIKMCLGYVLHKTIKEKDKGRKRDLAIEMAAAFTACQDLGVEVDGYDAAFMDKDRRRLSAQQRQKAKDAFVRSFSASEFILELVEDVNQKQSSSSKEEKSYARNFDLNKLYTWASEQDKARFDRYSIYYDESRGKEYLSPQEEQSRSIVPYLSPNVAREILTLLGVVDVRS